MSSFLRLIAPPLLLVASLGAALVWAQQDKAEKQTSEEDYQSSEQILQDSAVSFPVDI